MNTLLTFLLLTILAVSSLFAADGDLLLSRIDPTSHRPKEYNLSPTANGLFGFDSSGRPANKLIGTDVQAYSAKLDAIALLTTAEFGLEILETVDAAGLRLKAGLNNVDNTSDANKPVSTAQAAADALKANLAGGNTFSGTQSIAKLAMPPVDLGTIAGAGTAAITNASTVFYGTFSGSTANITLPSSPTDGVVVLHGITTYAGGTQTITFPALVRPEADFDTARTTFTNPASSGGYFTVQFTALGGSWIKVSVNGDTLAESGGGGDALPPYVFWPTALLASKPSGYLVADGTEGTEDLEATGSGTWIQEASGIAPSVSSAALGTDGESLTISMSENVTGTGTSGGGFALTSSTAEAITLGSVSGSGTSSLTATTSRVILDTEILSLAYTPGDYEDGIGLPLAAFTGAEVTNNSEEVAASGPVWMGEISAARKTENASTGTTTLTTNVEVPAGSRIVVIAWSYLAAGQSVGSVTDGTNTYTLDVSRTWGNSSDIKTQIASALVASPLASGSTITVNWNSPSGSYRTVFAGYIANSTGAVDQIASATSLGTSPSASATTSVDGVAVGILMIVDVLKTYTPTWDQVGAIQDYGSLRSYYLTETTTAGTNNPAGTLSASTRWALVWANYP